MHKVHCSTDMSYFLLSPCIQNSLDFTASDRLHSRNDCALILVICVFSDHLESRKHSLENKKAPTWPAVMSRQGIKCQVGAILSKAWWGLPKRPKKNIWVYSLYFSPLCNHHWNVWLGCMTRSKQSAKAGHPYNEGVLVPRSHTYTAKKALKSREDETMVNQAGWGGWWWHRGRLGFFNAVQLKFLSVWAVFLHAAGRWGLCTCCFALLERSHPSVTQHLELPESAKVCTAERLHQTCFKKIKFYHILPKVQHIWFRHWALRPPPSCQLVHLIK